MAGDALFLGWGPVVRGRELKALEVFQETLTYYGSLQQEGRIDSFEPVLIAPHGGDLAGFILLRGSRGSLDEVRSATSSGDWSSVRLRSSTTSASSTPTPARRLVSRWLYSNLSPRNWGIDLGTSSASARGLPLILALAASLLVSDWKSSEIYRISANSSRMVETGSRRYRERFSSKGKRFLVG